MAARTLAQLRTAVEDMGFGVDLATAQNGWINSEYRLVAGERRWPWLQARMFIATTPGIAAYSPPMTDIRSWDAVRLADSQGNELTLDARPTQWIQDHIHRYNQVTDRGAPRWWGPYAGQLYLYPIPDQVYTAQVDYTKNITPLVADTDVPIIPEEYDDILVWGAVKRAAVRQNNWLTRDFAEGQRQAVLNRMLSEIGKEQTQRADEVEWTGMWDQPWP